MGLTESCLQPARETTPPIDRKQKNRINAIITHWFGKKENWDRSSAPTKEHAKMWFGGLQIQDREITEKFMGDYEKYINLEYEGWKYDKDGKLAAIILLDQFSRHFFYGKREAFAQDKLALKISQDIIKDAELFA